MSNSFFRRRFPTLLAFFALLFFGLSGLRAQSNTEYNFRHQSTIVGDRYSNDADDAPQLTMSCLAANGYGQWTLSATAGTGITDVPTSKFVAGWYLLANGLYKPSTEYVALDPAHPGCFPPGVVQSDTLTFPTEVKATTNLSGMAGFAWPDQTTRQFFTQFGFTASDVDLSFSFLTNPVPPMHEVASAIHSWPNVSTSVGLLTHAVVSEIDFRDNSDVCSDGYYNYYVWASTDHPLIPGQKEIWVTIVPIGSGTALAGFPMQINAGGYFDGKFPTITCDPRNNRIGSPSPAFDVAYIQPSTNSIIYGSWSGVGWTTPPTALANSFWDPNLGSPGTGITWVSADHARIIRNSIYGGTSSLAIYAIVNSNNGVALAGLTPALIFYDPAHLTGTANYVAGSMMAPPAPIPAIPLPVVHDAPIIAFADPYDNQANWHETDEFHCLYQYDLGIDASPRFPLCIVRGADVAAAWPDLYSAYTPDPSHEDTRLVLNQLSGSLENDPTNNWYVGAVNQMGIHVHWLADSSGKNVHYYARDQNRTFDEPIDENTLVTDICTVSDGSATGTNHGGTVGAEVLDLTRMAIWTDGNYGANLSDHTGDIGLWQPGTLYPVGGYLDPHVGTLNFIGENAVLQIGGLGADDLDAVLTDMPYFFCNFDPEVTGQGITIGPGSLFDYYGLIANHNTDGSIKYSGVEALLSSPFVIGGTDPIFGGGIITLAGVPSGGRPVLNIHGGADFGIGTGGELLSSFPAEIQVLYDGNVYPIPPHSRHVTGHATLHGYTLLDTTIVEGNIPADSAAVIATIIGYEGGGLFLGGHPQFDAESSWIGNADTNGASVILAEPELKPYDGITFNGCELDAANFHAIGPGTQTTSFLSDYAINIENCSFYEQHGRTIFIENLDAPTGLDEIYYNRPINITSNNFHTINHTLNSLFNPDGNPNEVYGIYIKGLDGNYADSFADLEGTIIVEDNNFTGKNWSNVYSGYPTPPNFENAAAICFENTTGNIIGNTIDDTVYTNGIWLRATLPTGYLYIPTSRTFVCSNTIQHLHPPAGDADPAPYLLTGIRTEYYNTGYIKLNTIQDCEVGLSSNGDDFSYGFMIFNTIDNTHNSITYDIQQAIRITANSSMENALDLSGIHGGGNDLGGFNDISGTYSDWETGLITVGCNAVLNLGTWLNSVILACPTCVNFGQNNLRLCTGPLSGCTQPTASAAYVIKGLCGTAAPLNGVDANFWGLDGSLNKIDPANGGSPGSDPENWNLALGASQVNSLNITYTVPTATLGAASSFSDVTCGSSRAVAGLGKGAKTQAIDSLSPYDSCLHFALLGDYLEQQNEYTLAFDTAKYGIAHCYNTYPQAAINAIGVLSTSIQGGGGGPQPQAGTNEWNYLLSLLQLRPGDGSWVCAIAQQLPGSPDGITVDTTWQEANTKTNEGLSLMYWIIHDSPCSSFGTNDSSMEYYYLGSRQSQYESYLNWPGLDRDTVPFDTTIYTLQELGLDSILKYMSLLGVSSNTPNIITNPTAYPNPTGEGTVISFGIAKEAYVIINLYDVLGHQVSSAGFEGVVEPGNLSVPISLQGLPSGTYFARIQTTYGEAETVKLVKE